MRSGSPFAVVAFPSRMLLFRDTYTVVSANDGTISNGLNMSETTAERIKREKDGLDVWTDILG